MDQNQLNLSLTGDSAYPRIASIDDFGCRGSSIKTSAGYVDIENPQPSMIDIACIAASLSKICRFGGQCPMFYSVAEHSCYAAFLARVDGFPTDAVEAVLLHDAVEAYLGDVVKPLKNLLPEYQILEKRMESAIEHALGVDFGAWSDVIKSYDRLMLKIEVHSMWTNDEHEWTDLETIEDRPFELHYWTPYDANRKFMEMYNRLQIQ